MQTNLLPNLIGFIIFAQPSDRSRPVLPYAVVQQDGKRFQVVPTTGGLLSSQIESIHFYNSTGGWTLIGYQIGNAALNQLLGELTQVLENTWLTLTDFARSETVRTREAILAALDYRMRQQRIEDRAAEDARIAAARAKEDEQFAGLVEAASADPSPKPDSFAERPFGTGVDIDVVIRAPNAELLEATKERLRTALRGAHFNF
jgi:hypothetical protein